jgi:excisionase family DNA binding protein
MPQQTVTFSRDQEQSEERGSQMEKDDLLTIREVAQRLRVDTTTVRRWISLGLLEAIVLPHRGKRQAYRVRRRTLDQLLQAGSAPFEALSEAQK